MLFLKLNEPAYFGSFLYELIKNPKTDVYSKEVIDMLFLETDKLL